jgi:hypothetical protein
LSSKRLGILLILIGVAVLFGIDAFLMPFSLGVVFVGIGLFAWASLKQRAQRRLEQTYEAAPKKAETPSQPPIPRKCPECGADLSTSPADIKICPYCGVGLGKESNRLSSGILTIRRLLGLSTLVVLAPRTVIAVLPVFIFPPAAFMYLLPIWFFLLVAFYLLLSKRHRLIFECVLLVVSALSFLGMAKSLFIMTDSALLFKKYLPIIDTEEVLFFFFPFIAQGLTLSSTLFSASTSLLRKVKGLQWTKKRNLKIFIALLTLTPLILMLIIPVQANPGPPFNIGISAPGGGSRLQMPYAPGPPPACFPAYLDYNATGKQWIYRIHFAYLGGPPGQVTINKILLGSEVLAPPFNSNLIQVNGTGIVSTQDGIVFTQDADGCVTLKSTQAYTKIVFFDSDGVKYTFIW